MAILVSKTEVIELTIDHKTGEAIIRKVSLEVSINPGKLGIQHESPLTKILPIFMPLHETSMNRNVCHFDSIHA